MVWLRFINVSLKNLLLSWHNYQVDEENGTLYLDHKVSRSLGSDQEKVHGSTNFNTSKLANGVSCAH